MVNDVTFIGTIEEKLENGNIFNIKVIQNIYSKEKGEIVLTQVYTCYIENNSILEYIEPGDNVMIKSSFIAQKEPYLTDLLVYSINKIGRDLDNNAYHQSLIFHGRINTPTESVTTTGKPRLSFSIAITKRFSPKIEEPVTIWVNITTYQQAVIDKYKTLLPGTSVVVTGGRLQIRTDKDKIYSEVIVGNINCIIVTKFKEVEDGLNSEIDNINNQPF